MCALSRRWLGSTRRSVARANSPLHDEIAHRSEISFRLARREPRPVRRCLIFIDAVLSMRKHDGGDRPSGSCKYAKPPRGLGARRIDIILAQNPELRRGKVTKHRQWIVLEWDSRQQGWADLAQLRRGLF